MRKLLAFLVFFAFVYAAVAFLPLGRNYVAVRFAAQKLAGRKLSYSERFAAIEEMVRELKKAGSSVRHRDVDYTLPADDRPEVTVDVSIPVTFPLIDSVDLFDMVEARHVFDFHITAKGSKVYGATE